MGVKDFYDFIDSLYRLGITNYENFSINKVDLPCAYVLNMSETSVITTSMSIVINSSDNAYSIRDMINTLQIKPFSYALNNKSLTIDDLSIGIYPTMFNKVTILYSLQKLGLPIIVMPIEDLSIWEAKRNNKKINNYLDGITNIESSIGIIILDNRISTVTPICTNISAIIFMRFPNVEFVYINNHYFTRSIAGSSFGDIEKIFDYCRKYIVEYPKGRVKSATK